MADRYVNDDDILEAMERFTHSDDPKPASA